MNKRKERNHLYGHSNIDFRSKNDLENLKLFQPWKMRTAFGTMGYAGYKIEPDEKKKIMVVSEKINNQKSILSEVPDPRYYRTAQYYNEQKIKIKEKSIFTNERVAQLDESFKGKDVYTGDSMMISDINKFRRMKTKKGFVDATKIKNQVKQNLIIKDKSSKNKEAIQETQLVNIDAEKTLEDKVDINKLKEIRLALRRRYANRTNFRKIFKEWDNCGRGHVSIYDGHSMINKLGIPINYNETRALIASSNNRQTENLNLEEFMHLIFSDNPALELDLKALKFKDEKLYSEGEQMENLKKNMRNNMIEMSKTSELKILKEYLRIRIPSLVTYLNAESKEEGFCDFNAFSTSIKKFTINEKYTAEPLLRAIYEEFKVSESEDKMDFKKFVHSVIDNKEITDFFHFKERYVQSIKDKIDRNSYAISESILSLKTSAEQQQVLAKEIEKDILSHKKKEKIEEKYEVPNYIPSTEFVNKIFANKELYYQKHKDLEKDLSAHPSFLKEMPPKSRYGANPPHQNTFTVIQAPEYASTYISERERFDVRGKCEVDFLQKEKQKKNIIDQHKIEKLRNINNSIIQNIQTKDYINQEKDVFSQLQKTIKLYNYERINQRRNDLIE